MHRFNVNPQQLKDSPVTLDKDEAHHALSVLRVKAGEAVELLDGKGGIHTGFIAVAEKGRVQVSVRGQKTSPGNNVKITLGVSVIKPDTMDLLVQKASELGADRLIPLVTERTVVRLSPERWKGKAARWQKIAQEACKQCGRAVPTQVEETMLFKGLLPAFNQYDLVLIPTLAGSVEDLRTTLDRAQDVRSVLILIGPEGDFSDGEVQQALLSGAKPVSLGDLVMRSETAALFALSVCRFYLKTPKNNIN